jgi:hypothetical protein
VGGVWIQEVGGRGQDICVRWGQKFVASGAGGARVGVDMAIGYMVKGQLFWDIGRLGGVESEAVSGVVMVWRTASGIGVDSDVVGRGQEIQERERKDAYWWVMQKC